MSPMQREKNSQQNFEVDKESVIFLFDVNCMNPAIFVIEIAGN
jgi:hypothetical protein